MSQELKHLRGPGVAVLLVAVSCLVFSCATTPPAAPATGPTQNAPAAGGAAPAKAAPLSPAAPQPSSGRDSGASGGLSSPAGSALPAPPPAKPAGAANPAQETAPSGGSAGHGPAQPDLSSPEVSRELASFGAAGSWPLATNGHVLFLKRRPSASSGVDVFAVFAAVEHAADAQVSILSDFSRLFKSDLPPVVFSLVEFRETGAHLQRVHTFPLGTHLVFESFKIIPIKKGSDEPFAVSVTFQTQEGSDEVWETFSALGNSQITLKQTLSRSPIIEDIDNDGYLDIIYRERGIEEGTGYETFLTWYKWNGKSFVEYKTTNIVRNLREFLDRAAALLSEDKTAEFFRVSLPGADLAKLHGKSASAIFDEVFHLLPSSPDNPNEPVADLATIHQVIFPNIFENPFTEQSRNGYRFPLTVRFVTSDGSSHFYSAKIYMSRNPFVAPEFTFAVGPSKDSR